jgi:hypothetical protein
MLMYSPRETILEVNYFFFARLFVESLETINIFK